MKNKSNIEAIRRGDGAGKYRGVAVSSTSSGGSSPLTSSGGSSPRTGSGRVHRVPAQVLKVPPLQIASAMSSAAGGAGCPDKSFSQRRHVATPQAWNCDAVRGRDLDGRERRRTRHAESMPSPLRSSSETRNAETTPSPLRSCLLRSVT